MRTIDKILLTTLIVGIGTSFVGRMIIKNEYLKEMGYAIAMASIITKGFNDFFIYRRESNKNGEIYK